MSDNETILILRAGAGTFFLLLILLVTVKLKGAEVNIFKSSEGGIRS